MIKRLTDLCLDCVCLHFHCYCFSSNRRLDLPPLISEHLLHRLIDHDYLYGRYLPAITYNLLAPRLSRLDVYKSELLDDAFLTQVGRACTRLSRIRFVRCPSISDEGLGELLVNQTRLEYLELRWLPSIDGRCLARFSIANASSDKESPRRLQFLSLKGCAGVLPENVYSCVQRNRSIRILNLCGLRRMSGEWLRKISSVLGEDLSDLDVSECPNVNDDGLYSLAEKCSELRRLSLRECMNVGEAGLRTVLRFCSKLESVDLAFCRRWGVGLSHDLFLDIPATTTHLCLSGIQAEFTVEQFVSGLKGLTQLSHLILNGFGLLDDACLEKILSAIGHQLETLDLSGSFGRLSDHGLEPIVRHCSQLRVLGLGLLANLTGLALLPLFADRRRSELFEKLLLPGVSFDRRLLSLIAANCTNLQVLDVSALKEVDDSFLVTLAESSSGDLRRLFLKGLKITDEGICALATHAKGILSLCLSGNSMVTDKAIFALASNCNELQELYLNGCRMVSRESIRYLQDCCTGRAVVYHRFPTPEGAICDTVIAKNLDTGEFVRL